MNWLRVFLLPFAFLYGFGVWIRNLLFDWGILPSESFNIPVISIGNLSAGGSGKTPHVEYLVRLLQHRYTIAVLSRGYKRNTKGYMLAGPESSATDIGDEPLQMIRKFPDIYVAVHENRREGIRQLRRDHPDINLVLLDDAFQHRYVRAGLNLLLTGYYNPFFRNFLLPVGNLREAKFRAKRADAVLVTKTPRVFSPLDRRYFLQRLQPYRLKKVFFSKLSYEPWVPLHKDTPRKPPAPIKTIFLLSGIARTEALEEHLKRRCRDLFLHKYRDHHHFTPGNIKKLSAHFNKTIGQEKVVVTTEKDAMRLYDPALKECLKDIPVYYIPVRVVLNDRDKQKFDRMVYRFLEQYQDSHAEGSTGS